MKNWIIGYCTNVHTGTSTEDIIENLSSYSGEVRDQLARPTLPVGLWIPHEAAASWRKDVSPLKQTLVDHALTAYTINAFPWTNFHGDVVKRDVYQPPWWDERRADYTLAVAEILAALMDENLSGETDASDAVGSISTLPLGWRGGGSSSAMAAAGRALQDDVDRAASNLRRVADGLRRLESKTGRRITLAIEPEPGCLLDHSEQVVELFGRELTENHHRRHLSVCHDVCHGAVMGQSQREILSAYKRAGIEVGKLQVSSGIVARWDTMAHPRRIEAAKELSKFAEDRYLHQTGRQSNRQDSAGDGFQLAEDLPDLLSGGDDPSRDDDRWVVHFHVPIFLDRFGHLATTQGDIIEALAAVGGDVPDLQFTGHVEVETYAWSVLPPDMRRRKLTEDIADEFRWLDRTLSMLFR